MGSCALRSLCVLWPAGPSSWSITTWPGSLWRWRPLWRWRFSHIAGPDWLEHVKLTTTKMCVFSVSVFLCLRCKQEEVEQKASDSPKGTVMLYRWLLLFIYLVIYFFSIWPSVCIFFRCGDHVLLSGGPLVARTGLCSQYEVTAMHSLGQGPWGHHRRTQGLSLPLQLQVSWSKPSKFLPLLSF